MNVAIYMEGGGQGKNTKSELRMGMEVFLAEVKSACQRGDGQWKLVCCGPRNEAYQLFQNALKDGGEGVVALLVDSEIEIDGSAPVDHLVEVDKWNLEGINNDVIHLMVQTMEAWIVADPTTLKAYYGRGFREDVLPQVQNLEEVGKKEIEEALKRATQGTGRGRYHKIRHARELLRLVDPKIVRRRCSHCERLFTTILSMINYGG